MAKFRYPSKFRSFERDDIVRPSLPASSVTNPRLTREERERYRTVKEFLNDAERVKVVLTERPKADWRSAALLDVRKKLSQFREEDFSNQETRRRYRALRAHEEGLKKSTAAKPAGADRRFFNPEGTVAVRRSGSHAGLLHKLQYGSAWSPVFLNPASVIPCIQRWVRREVMFATGKAGKGYRTPHRRSQHTGVPC